MKVRTEPGEQPLAHREAFELLPWLVNDTLPSRQARVLRAHTRDCRLCQRELEEQRQLQQLLRNSSIVPLPTDKSFARLRSRLDAGARDPAPALAGWRRHHAIAAGLTLLCASALLLFALSPDAHRSGGEFVTLTAPAPAVAPAVQVVFEQDLSEAQMRAALHAAGGEIVAGPSREGIYTIALAAGRPGDIEALLLTLQADARVRLAVRSYPAAER